MPSLAVSRVALQCAHIQQPRQPVDHTLCLSKARVTAGLSPRARHKAAQSRSDLPPRITSWNYNQEDECAQTLERGRERKRKHLSLRQLSTSCPHSLTPILSPTHSSMTFTPPPLCWNLPSITKVTDDLDP